MKNMKKFGLAVVFFQVVALGNICLGFQGPVQTDLKSFFNFLRTEKRSFSNTMGMRSALQVLLEDQKYKKYLKCDGCRITMQDPCTIVTLLLKSGNRCTKKIKLNNTDSFLNFFTIPRKCCFIGNILQEIVDNYHFTDSEIFRLVEIAKKEANKVSSKKDTLRRREALNFLTDRLRERDEKNSERLKKTYGKVVNNNPDCKFYF
ncbi:MAG: hypothetical protein JW725_03670 [Candidatus Babeliaceae bacterium]|nr:hypothetical protein [Candidatus Babeliaceae bacterium]